MLTEVDTDLHLHHDYSSLLKCHYSIHYSIHYSNAITQIITHHYTNAIFITHHYSAITQTSLTGKGHFADTQDLSLNYLLLIELLDIDLDYLIII